MTKRKPKLTDLEQAKAFTDRIWPRPRAFVCAFSKGQVDQVFLAGLRAGRREKK